MSKKFFLTSIKNKLCSTVSSIFGTINWSSPPWIAFFKTKAQKTPRLFWGSLLSLVLGIFVITYGLYVYYNQPQPDRITAVVTVPEPSPLVDNDQPITPNNLVINFGLQKNDFVTQSVAPIDLVGKTVSKGLTITPAISGQWTWNSDSELIFVPTEDWQAGQKYTVHFEKNAFTSAVLIKHYDVSFKTKSLKAKIISFELYQDPITPDLRKAVATIEFNASIDTQLLEKHTTLQFLSDKSAPSESATFSYTYDKHNRIAYLTSEQLKIKDVARYLLLNLNKGIASSTNSSQLTQGLAKTLLIPDSSNFLKVVSSSASIIRNERDTPEQILNIETTLGVNEHEFNKSVHIYLLPKDYPATYYEKAIPDYNWQNPGQITDKIRALSTPLNKEPIPTELNYASLHSYKFKAQTPRYIYIKVDKGMHAFGGFTLANDYEDVIPVPALPKEISFLHKGSLLALGGDKKLSVLARGLSVVKFDFARVLPSNVNQLVTQTQGDFNNPTFINPSFNQQNISHIKSEILQFNNTNPAKQQYTALDLSHYLTNELNPLGPQGLFLLQATEWDPVHKTSLDAKTSRLILVTDLGMLVKDNQDGSHDVFVESITQGTPVAHATVTVLGKNGLPVVSRLTDDQGRANFPNLKDFIEDKEPTVYLAGLGNDVSFIPFNNYSRQLNFTKFDIGGIYTNNQDLQSLGAYLFTDRGIYRPGDTMHVGMIVKQAYAKSQPFGLPLQATILDSRGTTVKDVTLTLNDTGYLELDFTSSPHAPTGQYTVNLFLVKDNHPQNLLGTTTFKVSEFQPDRMRITSTLFPESSDGWVHPTGLKAKINLRNLYGNPAAHRKISAKIMLTPQQIAFDRYPNYIFVDPLLDPKKPSKTFTESLPDLKSNEQGQAEWDLHLERFEKATYQLTFFAEGFEADSGRSVTTQSKVLVSPLPYFIGYKPDGDLSFIKQNSMRTINYLGINPQLKKESIQDLKIELTSLHPVTTLIKKPNGTYAYQSIIQSKVIDSKPFEISETGTLYQLPTEQIGDYSLKVLDKEHTILSQLKFSVVGSSQHPLAKNAELSIKLNKSEYKAGEDIEIQITAPYTGSGLITIERDKVYATQWFKSNTTNSLQTIHIPASFEGNGYVNVAFIRDWESPELFISPLSYSVVPFSINHDNQNINIELKTPKHARPGDTFTIDYKSDKPGKIIVFAIDEGILQVARYTTPNPLAFFFQKHALEVLTQQTIDQILPKFIQDRELSAVGGDGSDDTIANRLNPFKRKTDLPVVYWSGIVTTDNTNRQLTYTIPDYFNGSLKVMAVAVASDSVGSTDTTAEIRGDFIINPNVLTFVAPGDTFQISATVANNIKNSGEHTPVTIELNASSEIEILDSKSQILEIKEGQEQVVSFKLRAQPLLGSANITFSAKALNKSASMHATLSVRPPVPFTTNIKSAQFKQTKQSLDILQSLYPEHRNIEASVSTSPLVLVFGLERYLENYPYGCTEQLVSKALPLLAMNNQPWFQSDHEKINKSVNATIQMLTQRQMSNGGFSYWPESRAYDNDAFASIYAMQFLTEARAQGFSVSNDLFARGLYYLKNLASQNPHSLDNARIQAYAIYILTSNEIVTTNYLAHLQAYLQKDTTHAWEKDITSVYLAASYQLLKSTDNANQLIGYYDPKNKSGNTTDFFDINSTNAQYLYIVSKYFPNMLSQVDDKIIGNLVSAINNNDINTLLSAYISLALSTYQSIHESQHEMPPLSIVQQFNDNKEITTLSNNRNYQKLAIEPNVKSIQIINPEKSTLFYQLTQAGFDKNLPTIPIKRGIEIYREYRDATGTVINNVILGDEIEVHIQIRALDNGYFSNVVIEDLLPGGFEVVTESIKSFPMDFVDAREDRVNYFGSIESSTKEIIYKIKAINSGEYVVPPPYAEAMYNPEIKSMGIASHITVAKSRPSS